MGRPGWIGPDEDWLARACTEKTGRLRRLVKWRIEEFTQGSPATLTALTVDVTDDALDDFSVCQEIASREARRPLTSGQTFGVVVQEYRGRHEGAAKSSRERTRTRRVGPTDEDPESRYVPREVMRALEARSGGVCEVPGCQRAIGTERLHLRPPRKGSGREVHDLAEGCHRHHTLFDAGLLHFAGWTPEGRPMFRTASGEVLVPRAPESWSSGAREAGARGVGARESGRSSSGPGSGGSKEGPTSGPSPSPSPPPSPPPGHVAEAWGSWSGVGRYERDRSLAGLLLT